MILSMRSLIMGELTITTTQGKFIAHETLNWLKSHLDSQRFIQVAFLSV